MSIGLDHSILMILLVCRHLDCIFHYSLSGRRDRMTGYWWSGDTLRRNSSREILRVKLGTIQGQTVFALCSDELNS